jgi:hypothetical protein
MTDFLVNSTHLPGQTHFEYELDSANFTNDTLNEFENLDIDEEFTHTGITRLTQVLAILGVCISMVGIVGNFFSIIVLNRKAMKKLSTYTYLLGLSVCDEISLTFTVIILFHYAIPTNTKIARAFNFNYKILLIYIYVSFYCIFNQYSFTWRKIIIFFKLILNHFILCH